MRKISPSNFGALLKFRQKKHQRLLKEHKRQWEKMLKEFREANEDAKTIH